MMADETLSPQRKYGLLLASAIATRNPIVTAAMETAAGVVMTPAAVEAAKSAASVMAMNNVYYRFVHLASIPEYKTMPEFCASSSAKLIMGPAEPSPRSRRRSLAQSVALASDGGGEGWRASPWWA